MSLSPDALEDFMRRAAALCDKVMARDDLYLAPGRAGPAAIGRFKTGLAAIESWLRHVLILLALQLEHGLEQTAPYAKNRNDTQASPRGFSFHVIGVRPAVDPQTFERLAEQEQARRLNRHLTRPPLRIEPFLARLAALKAIIAAPYARARRLAYYLARRRPGPILAPVCRGAARRILFGTEMDSLHDAMGHAIPRLSWARPPPLGPAPKPGPKPGPRIRWL